MTHRGDWFWPSEEAAAQYQRERGGLPWPSTANHSTGGDPAIIGWQRRGSQSLDAWLDGPVLVAVGFDRAKGRWRQVVCLRGGRRDLDLLLAEAPPRAMDLSEPH